MAIGLAGAARFGPEIFQQQRAGYLLEQVGHAQRNGRLFAVLAQAMVARHGQPVGVPAGGLGDDLAIGLWVLADGFFPRLQFLKAPAISTLDLVLQAAKDGLFTFLWLKLVLGLHAGNEQAEG